MKSSELRSKNNKKIIVFMMISLLLVFSLYCVSKTPKYTGEIIFPTVQIIIDHIKTIPERPTPDTADWSHLSFEKFFQRRQHPKIWADITSSLRFGANLEKSFNNQMKKIIKQRHNAGLMGHFAMVLRPEPDSHFVIMANLNGSFQLLVRFLEFAYKRNIIDNDFVLNPSYFLVFDGNALGDSPYSVDTLAVILRLIEKNPNQVFYIRGKLEDKGAWQKTNFNTEVETRSSKYQTSVKLINTLFDTLPLALYLFAGQNIDNSINLVRICNNLLINAIFNEHNAAALFADPQVNVIKIDDQSSKYATVPVNVKAIISGSPKASKTGKGLKQSQDNQPCITWQLQSGALGYVPAIDQFVYESFVILKTATTINDWTLTLYSRNIKKSDSLEAKNKINLITGHLLPDKEVKENLLKKYREKRSNLLWQLDQARQKANTLHNLFEQKK